MFNHKMGWFMLIKWLLGCQSDCGLGLFLTNTSQPALAVVHPLRMLHSSSVECTSSVVCSYDVVRSYVVWTWSTFKQRNFAILDLDSQKWIKILKSIHHSWKGMGQEEIPARGSIPRRTTYKWNSTTCNTSKKLGNVDKL